jgi:uncharacterized protein (TIGR00255 family)
MLKSMTAYARGQVKNHVGRFVVEIQSVNRKYLEINSSIPHELLRFDGEIKKWLAEFIHRGQINFKLFVDYAGVTPVSVIPNLPFIHQLKKAWDKIAQELGMDGCFTLDMLKDEKGVLLCTEEFLDEESYRLGIKEAVSIALIDLIKMKVREGASLATDINMRLNNLNSFIDQIEHFAPEATTKYREKLIAKLTEISPHFIENEERILKEICLFSEKVDIVEEVTRFKSHLTQFSDLLNSNSGTIGKTLEFLVQEINRETNTIGSKASHIEVTKLVIEIKSELERIREQIQNVE